MGQIIGGAAKPKRCNLNQLNQVPTPAAGEHILVSSDNSMNAAGQGYFDSYIMGNGTTAATSLELHKFKAEELEDYIKGSNGVDVSYSADALVNTDTLLQNNGKTRGFTGFGTSDFIQIPSGARYLYTKDLYKNDANTYIGLKFYTSNDISGVIAENVCAADENIPTSIDLQEWSSAKYVRFCSKLSTASIRFYTEAGESEFIASLIAQESGTSTTKAMSQKAVTDALGELSNEIDNITGVGVDVTYNDDNTEMVTGLLNVNGSLYSSSSYKTSPLTNIPAGTTFIDTYGLYRNDAGVFIGLLLFDENGTILPLVCENNTPIPSTIDLSNYPTATQIRWSHSVDNGAYVRFYSVSAIKTAVLEMTSGTIGDSDETLMTQKGITNALAKMSEQLVGIEYTKLQEDPLTVSTNKWTFGNAWTFSSGGATPPAVGAENYMRNTSIYYSDRRYMRVTALMGADTKLIIACGYGSSLNAGEGASAFGVDFDNKKLIIYGVPAYGGISGDTQATSTGYDLTKELETATIPVSAIGARKYVVELRKHGTISQLILMDTKTGEKVSVAHDGWACGRQNQLYGFYCDSGTLPTLSNFYVYGENNPDIVFAGDSITEGVYVNDRKYTYPNRYRSALPSKKVVVSARGGQTISGLMSLFDTEWNIVRPKAISLLIGANGGNSASYFTQFKNACDAIGAKLYVHYCSCRTGRDLSETNDTLVPALNLESAHFDWATAIDNTPNSSYSNINTSLFADSTHPNIAGQAELYKRLEIDCPSIYL